MTCSFFCAFLCSNNFVRPQNDTLLRALLREPTEYTPIWLMRQAGRYMAEYNATRKRAGSFLGLAKSPAYATEVTLQPVDRFALDAAILFSDILTVPDAMGLGLYFVEGEGPKFERPIRTEADVNRLAPPDPNIELRYVTDTVREVRTSARQSHPADRIFRQSVHVGVLHDRRRRLRRLPLDQDDAVFETGPAASST